jgi:hypothetical protein
MELSRSRRPFIDPRLLEEALELSGERRRSRAMTMFVDTRVGPLALRRDAGKMQ